MHIHVAKSALQIYYLKASCRVLLKGNANSTKLVGQTVVIQE